jgi:adenosylcobinamide kinase/adenosylcobinamide-phosphate guanylyltransferase
MIVLVIGGSGSGKSEYAEGRCVAFDSEKKLYIATMEPYDAESFRRIERHQKMRSQKNFDTLECYTHLEEVTVPKGCTVLLECMSNLVANEMFSENGRKNDAPQMIFDGIVNISRQAKHVVIVTNQVFSDGITYDAGTDAYLRMMAEVNNRIGAIADEVVEVVHGIPLFIKGESSIIG